MTERRAGWPDHGASAAPVWADASFAAWLQQHPSLAALRTQLPAAFSGQDRINQLVSSYFDRGYGSLFYALVRALAPKRCVEIGLFQGFSLLTAAAALRDNGLGKITGYDLFEDYPYRHAERSEVARQIHELDLEPWVTLQQADVTTVHTLCDEVDYLHVDVSNTGDTYRQVFARWSNKVTKVILLEGGSRERDNVDWMIQYGKPAIVPALDELRPAHPEWRISVLEPFPSLTVALRDGRAGTSQP